MDMKYIFKLEEIALDIFNALNINTETPVNPFSLAQSQHKLFLITM